MSASPAAQLSLVARPGELSRRRGLRAVALAPTVTERCRDCGEAPAITMWKTCRACWDVNRARHADPAGLERAA